MILSLFKRNRYRAAAQRLYDHLVSGARHPLFYTEYEVPDTVEGRFEMVALHVFAVMNRLKAEGVNRGSARDLSQALFDRMFKNMDEALREAGVGDLSVPKKMKFMMAAMNGRCHAYEAALGTDLKVEQAIRRNLYGTITSPPQKVVQAMAKYLTGLCSDLRDVPFDRIVQDDFELMCSGGRHEKTAGG